MDYYDKSGRKLGGHEYSSPVRGLVVCISHADVTERVVVDGVPEMRTRSAVQFGAVYDAQGRMASVKLSPLSDTALALPPFAR